jgi:hypothetical protein
MTISKSSLFLNCTLVLLISIAGGAAQEQTKLLTPEKKKSERDSPEARLRLATIIQTLQNVANESKKWDNASAAARAQCQVADLLWDFDSQSSRGYLIQAWDSTGNIKQPQAPQSRYRNRSVQSVVRQEVLLIARKRAPELATKWLDQITSDEANASQENKNRGVFDDRSNRSAVLLEMALSTLPQDPSAAAQLAIESLNDGISFGLQAVLIGLQQKDPGLAQNVFRAALARLQNADPSEGLVLYGYLYTPGRTVAPNTSADRGTIQIAVGRSSVQIRPAAELYPQLALEFLMTASNSILNAPLPSRTENPETTARAQITFIDLLLVKMNDALPQQASALMTREAAIVMDARFSPSQISQTADREGTTETNREQRATRRVENLEQVAEREPLSSKRDVLYARAALATQADDYANGLRLTDKIQDDTLRTGVSDWIKYRAAQSLLKAKNFDQAYKLLAKNSNAVQRAAGLVLGAQALTAIKDPTRAREWLYEAQGLIKKAEAGDDRVSVSLGIVAALGTLDQTAALEALSTAVNLIGDKGESLFDVDKAPTSQTFSIPDVVTPDPTYDTKGFGLRSAIKSFNSDQFPALLQLLDTIKRPEIRGSAIVLLSRDFLRREN